MTIIIIKKCSERESKNRERNKAQEKQGMQVKKLTTNQQVPRHFPNGPGKPLASFPCSSCAEHDATWPVVLVCSLSASCDVLTHFQHKEAEKVLALV